MLTNVKNDKNGTFNKEKFVRQLNVLSKIRDLKSIVDKLTDKIMKIKYTEEDDYFYAKGMKKGREESKNSMITALIKKGKLTLVEIAEIANVSLVYVQNLAEQLKK
jgi:hypothetical protein